MRGPRAWRTALLLTATFGLNHASLNVVYPLGQTVTLGDSTYYIPGHPEVCGPEDEYISLARIIIDNLS